MIATLDNILHKYGLIESESFITEIESVSISGEFKSLGSSSIKNEEDCGRYIKDNNIPLHYIINNIRYNRRNLIHDIEQGFEMDKWYYGEVLVEVNSKLYRKERKAFELKIPYYVIDRINALYVRRENDLIQIYVKLCDNDPNFMKNMKPHTNNDFGETDPNEYDYIYKLIPSPSPPMPSRSTNIIN